MSDHHVLLHQLAAAKTKAAHKRAIHTSSPAASKAFTNMVLEMLRHGHRPTRKLAMTRSSSACWPARIAPMPPTSRRRQKTSTAKACWAH